MNSQVNQQSVSPEPLMRLSWFYLAGKPLIAACNAMLFTLVDDGINTPELMAQASGMSIGEAANLLESMAALELLDVDLKRNYRNSRIASLYLNTRSEQYIGDTILEICLGKNSNGHQNNLMHSPNHNSAFDAQNLRPRDTEIIDGTAIHGLTSGSSMAFGKFFDFGNKTHLLDIAGGVAGTAIWAALANKDLEITILDTPSVCALGKAYTVSAGLEDRITFVEGDIFASNYPIGPDIHFCTNTFHGFTPEQCKLVIEKSLTVLPQGGVLVLHDRVLAKEAPPYSPVVNSGMLMLHQHGTVYTVDDYKDWMLEVGFSTVGDMEISCVPGFAYGIK